MIFVAKKSKATRQYNKQLQRQQKILRKAQQKGIRLDLTSKQQKQERITKKDVVNLRKQNIQYDRQVKNKTDNKTQLKLTNKQIQKAVQGKQQRIKPVKVIQPKVIKPKVNKPKVQIETEPVPSYLPEPPEHEYQDTVNEDTSFFTDAIINMYLTTISHYPNNAEPILKNWLNQMISKYGRDDVAMMLQDGASAGVVLTWEIAYNNERLQAYIADMLDFLPEMTVEWKEDVMDSFDDWRDIN